MNENWINYSFADFPFKSELKDVIKVRRYLIELARNKIRNTIDYQLLIDDCGIPCDLSLNKYIITNILEDILFYEFVNDRNFLTALVVSVTSKMPSSYFYDLVRKYSGDKYKDLDDKFIFLNEKEETINYWKNDYNYNKFKDYKSFLNLKKEYYYKSKLP